jgi:hypothetical protein
VKEGRTPTAQGTGTVQEAERGADAKEHREEARAKHERAASHTPNPKARPREAGGREERKHPSEVRPTPIIIIIIILTKPDPPHPHLCHKTYELDCPITNEN